MLSAFLSRALRARRFRQSVCSSGARTALGAGSQLPARPLCPNNAGATVAPPIARSCTRSLLPALIKPHEPPPLVTGGYCISILSSPNAPLRSSAMHDLSLYGQVTFDRWEQVLKILAGVAAMQPQRLLERRAMYKPLREAEEPGSNLRRGGTQAIAVKQTKQAPAPALFYTTLVQKLEEEDFLTEHVRSKAVGKPLSADVEGDEAPRWSFLFEDQPDTGDRGVSIRLTHQVDLLSGDPHEFMSVVSGPNRFIKEYYLEGYRFVHGNVIISLHRVLWEPKERQVQKAPKVDLPAWETLELLDKSGVYAFEAKVRVEEFNNAAVLDAGVNELLRFKREMQGCVELELPDRLMLDTRVKYKPPHAPATSAQNRPR